MIFRNFPELVLGSKTKLRVLLHLLAEPSMPTSEREVAKLIGTSHTAVNKVMKDFYDAHLVTPIKIGNVNAWKLNKDSYAYRAVSDIPWLAKHPPLESLKEDVKRQEFCHNPYITRVVIFGSTAKGTEVSGSDIDLFLLVEKEVNKKQVIEKIVKLAEHCITYYGNKLSPFVLTWNELESPEHQKLRESIKEGILIDSNP